MKRSLLILTVLFVSVLSTACINNLAIQELNNKAKTYLEAGDVDKAICRYQASLDLDSSIFETNYNLGVAYINKKEYSQAAEVLKAATKLNPNTADSYYSLGVALEGMGYDKVNGVTEKKVDSCVQEEETDEVAAEKPKELTVAEKEEVSKYFLDAIDSYNQYLSLNAAATDKSAVTAKIEALNEELKKYSVDETKAETQAQ